MPVAVEVSYSDEGPAGGAVEDSQQHPLQGVLLRRQAAAILPARVR